MKNISVMLLGLLLSLSSFASVSIISDFDDTIKITDVKSLSTQPSRTILNGIFSKKFFFGVNELHSEMSTYATETYVLSASPGILRGRIRSALNYNGLEFDQLITRSFFASEDKLIFKKESIQELFDNNSDYFILIGDDVELDPAVYLEMSLANPGKVLAIYIHNVSNAQLERRSAFVHYITTFDIAVNEYKAGRMTYDQALTIGEKILSATPKEMKSLIPSFAHCPKKPGDFPSFSGFDLKATALKIQAKVIKYCLLR